MSKLVYIIAGEPSGDILASRLMQALMQRVPDLRFTGVGGETMQALGFKTLFPIAELSVMGFWEVAPRLPLILRRMKQVMTDLEQQQPDVLVTVDSWGFVRAILKKVRKRKMKIHTVHYVAPQVWAWKKSRAPKAAKLMDRMMTLWPYEPPYFEKYGLRCDFVGHPVIENITCESEKSPALSIESPALSTESPALSIESPALPAESPALPAESLSRQDTSADLAQLKALYPIPHDCTLLCLLPGSRHSEVKRLIPIFKKVAANLHPHFPDLFVAIPSVDAIAKEVEDAFADLSIPHCLILGQRDRYLTFRACRFAVAASGSVTLELAACGAPHLIVYRFSSITNFVVKRLITTKYANLINILANRYVIPEFVLDNCRADLITTKTLHYLRHPEAAQEQVAQAKTYFAQLKPDGMTPSEKAASVVLDVMAKM